MTELALARKWLVESLAGVVGRVGVERAGFAEGDVCVLRS